MTGSARPAGPQPQSEPKNGTGPRLDSAKVARDVGRLPHSLLGLVRRRRPAGGRARRPAPKRGAGGVLLDVPPGTVPAGGRRAGLTAHRFWPRMVGQEQRIHTGWLTAEGGTVELRPAYAHRLPHAGVEPCYHLGAASLAFRMRGAPQAGSPSSGMFILPIVTHHLLAQTTSRPSPPTSRRVVEATAPSADVALRVLSIALPRSRTPVAALPRRVPLDFVAKRSKPALAADRIVREPCAGIECDVSRDDEFTLLARDPGSELRP